MKKLKSKDILAIGLSSYEAPRVERVRVKTEDCFAASQSVPSNNEDGVTVDTWTKTTGSDSDTWS